MRASCTPRRFAVILERLADGSVHLTAVSLLAPHLTVANHRELLDTARHKTKREVEQLIAGINPRPDVATTVRKLPAPRPATTPEPITIQPPQTSDDVSAQATPGRAFGRPEIKPLAPERFKVQFTVGRETYDKLRQAQDLLRHRIPNGDPAAIFDRALTLLIAELSKAKIAAADRPQAPRGVRNGSRHIPAAVRREVWRRDGGRCAFRGERGPCTETGFLEFHHVVPFAKGGATTTANLELRCRAHNVYEAEQHFGREMLPLCAREDIRHAPLGLDRVGTFSAARIRAPNI
jgi:hypothetical protein